MKLKHYKFILCYFKNNGIYYIPSIVQFLLSPFLTWVFMFMFYIQYNEKYGIRNNEYNCIKSNNKYRYNEYFDK